MSVIVKNHEPTEWIYERAVKQFGVSFEKGTTFTYGSTIYCITEPPDDLMAHELVHVKQQTEYDGGPDAWWERYFEDEEFRADQELKAYRRQYNWAKGNLKNRAEVFRILQHCAKGFSGPVYGNLMTFQEAMDFIQSKNKKQWPT